MIEKKRFVIILTTLLSVVLFLALLGVLILILFSNATETSSSSTHDYQLMEIQPFSSPSTTYGLVTLPKELGEEDYLSYHNEDTGSTTIISNFGNKEFECTGSCYCTEAPESSRRVTSIGSNVLTRGVMILLTAFSSSMALKLAKETFDKQCVAQFSEICDEPYILSESDCSEKDKSSTSQEELEPARKGDEIEDNYLCRGYCVKIIESHASFLDEKFDNPEYRKLGEQVIGDCSSKYLDSPVPFTPNLRAAGRQIMGVSDGDEIEDLKIVRVMFAQHILTNFCMKNSAIGSDKFSDEEAKRIREEIEVYDEEIRNSPPHLHPQFQIMRMLAARPWCFGYKQDDDNPYNFNVDNVKCVPMEG